MEIFIKIEWLLVLILMHLIFILGQIVCVCFGFRCGINWKKGGGRNTKIDPI
jgi:hypothetical protein